MEHQSASWDAAAAAYDSALTDAFLPFVHAVFQPPPSPSTPPHRLLDVGCGSGGLALLAASAGCLVTAIDHSPRMVDLLLRRRSRAALSAAQLTALVMDAQSLTFPDAWFDSVYSLFTVMFLPEPALAVREMRRVLRPGGRLRIATWNIAQASWVRRMNAAITHVRPEWSRRAAAAAHSHADLPPPSLAASFSTASSLHALLTTAGFPSSSVCVSPVEAALEFDDSTVMFNALADGLPSMHALMQRVTSDERARMEQHFVHGLTRGEEAGERYRYRLPGQAWLAEAEQPRDVGS